MESLTYIKYNRISPKKLRFILDNVKKFTPEQAIVRLEYSPLRTSKLLAKALGSALANASAALKIDKNLLQFKTLLVEEGPQLKRMRPGSRGMGRMFKRRSSHIKIVLVGKEGAEVTKVTNTEVSTPIDTTVEVTSAAPKVAAKAKK